MEPKATVSNAFAELTQIDTEINIINESIQTADNTTLRKLLIKTTDMHLDFINLRQTVEANMQSKEITNNKENHTVKSENEALMDKLLGKIKKSKSLLHKKIRQTKQLNTR